MDIMARGGAIRTGRNSSFFSHEQVCLLERGGKRLPKYDSVTG
jgi:hypothetical protein